MRYFFDIRDGDNVAIDEEGKELPDLGAAQEEAARSLADLTRDKIGCHKFCQIIIEVRDSNGPLFETQFVRETMH